MSDEIRESRMESALEQSDVKSESSPAEENQAPTENNNLTEAMTSTPSTNSNLPSPPPTTRSNGLRRLIWLDERVNEARAKTFGSNQPGWAEYDAARHARDGVVQIGETGQSSMAVLLLERDAAALLVRAYAARESVELSGGSLTQEDWEAIKKIQAILDAWNNLSAAQATNLVAATGPQGDQALANLPPAQRKTFAIGLHEFVNAIAEPLEFEANRLGRALFARYSRVTLVAVAVVVVVSLIVSWISSKFEKPNIALHHPVEVSSQYPGAGEDHSLLVDGDRSNLGFHTDCQGSGWAIIDLGAPKKFDKIVVYNRTEYPERAVPLVIEVSNDHQNFHKIAERKEVFDKWSATGLGAQGRYVKLRNTSANCFHLAEVEIY